jgi:Family of unknown function (DUF5762)
MEYFSDNLTKAKKYLYDKDEDGHSDNEEEMPERPMKRKKFVSVPFWSENPNVLFQREYSMEFFPIDSMAYEQKLNAITRTILILTIIGYIISQSARIFIVSAFTIFAIFILHHYHQKEKSKHESKKADADSEEGFQNATMDYLAEQKIDVSKADIFSPPDSTNPFSNVLVSDYQLNPEKKPALPAFNSNVKEEIVAQAKQLVREANPDQPDIADKLFKDLGEQLVFEQSLRQFNSNPSTTIPNDQGAFADFCYGSMISCKEGNSFACARNLSRYTN